MLRRCYCKVLVFIIYFIGTGTQQEMLETKHLFEVSYLDLSFHL